MDQCWISRAKREGRKDWAQQLDINKTNWLGTWQRHSTREWMWQQSLRRELAATDKQAYMMLMCIYKDACRKAHHIMYIKHVQNTIVFVSF